jgi:uncharacterized lipoprotein YddW (UPF0748 family)
LSERRGKVQFFIDIAYFLKDHPLKPHAKNLLAFIFTFVLCTTFAQRMPKRELRGAWIATYLNIDWPNRTQTPAAQQAALLTIFDHHKTCGCSTRAAPPCATT